MAAPEVHRYRRPLDRLPEPRALPAGLAEAPFEPERHAALLHALLVAAYRDGGGSVPGFGAWRDGLLGDAEYDPRLVLLVVDGTGVPVAAAICWTSAFVKDLVVAEGARRRGLGAWLLGRAFAAFRDRGAAAVDLKVEADNGAAVALYRSVGMARVDAP